MRNLQEWLELRKTGIGGSEAASIAGLNRWSSPMKVYMQKLGLLNPDPENDAMMLGTRFEPIIRQIYEERMGVKVVVPETIMRNEQYPFIIGTPDGLVLSEGDRGERSFEFDGVKYQIAYGLEVKYTGRMKSSDWGASGTDHVPPSYYLQCQHYMLVTGLSRWDLICVFGSTIFFYTIMRDEQVVNDLIKLENDFWTNHVLANNPPAIDGSEASTELLRQRFPKSEGYRIEVNDDIRDLAARYRRYEAIAEDAETELSIIRNNLISMLGDAEGCDGEDFTINYKSRSSGSMTDWKAVINDLKPLLIDPTVVDILADKHTKQKKDARPFKIEFVEVEE